jgi:NTP pyrophosphatase (non-canonical NTP hydrolase)
MDTKTELLVITMEECSELAQACSKLLRFDQEQDIERLTEEVGDVVCMLELLEERGYIDWQNVKDRVKYKREKLAKWSNIL